MEEPKYILDNGTWVKVHDNLNPKDTSGMLIKQEALDRRTPGVRGQICGIVGGHGGDVYWVHHEGQENTGSAYGWWEFELEPGPSRYERLTED